MSKKVKKTKNNDSHKGGIFLVVADRTEEFMLALRYATKIAQIRGGRVGIMRVVEQQGFQHWGGVEEQIRKEYRGNAEKFVWEIAKSVLEFDGPMPAFYVEEGPIFETLVDTINNDMTIKRLILATSVQPGNPGPLISYFTSKALSKLRVPLLIIPGHIEPQALEDLA